MKPERLSRQYTGRAAAGYDRNRAANPLWQAETAVVEGFLATLPPGATILDIPVGTGRFIELYARFGLRATGIDVSSDMLAQASKKAAALKLDVTLALGDIQHIAAPDDTFEAALCIRLAHLIETPLLRIAVAELARVARSYVVIGVPGYVPFAQLGSGLQPAILRFANQWVRRGKERIERFSDRPSSIAHEHEQIVGIFRGAGLERQSSATVKSSAAGVDYCIHVLRKISGNGA